MFYFVRQDLLQVHDTIEVVGHTDVTGALFCYMEIGRASCRERV